MSGSRSRLTFAVGAVGAIFTYGAVARVISNPTQTNNCPLGVVQRALVGGTMSVLAFPVAICLVPIAVLTVPLAVVKFEDNNLQIRKKDQASS